MRGLTQHGIKFIHGWSIPYKEMHVTVTAVVCLALDLVPNVKNPSHWWDLMVGSIPLAKVVCFSQKFGYFVETVQSQFISKNIHLRSLGISRTEQVAQNWHYIRTLAEIILLCSHQEITLRGHREGEESRNRGNFLEILNLIAIHDPVINERLKNGPKNAKYTSPDIQNTLINVMGRMVQESICSSVCKAGTYTILADETKDCSKKEQLAIVVRYVDVEAVTL